jgi:hypothetical protein
MNLEKLLQKFDQMDDEAQERVIRQVAKNDKNAAKALKNLQKLDKSVQKMKSIEKDIENLVN